MFINEYTMNKQLYKEYVYQYLRKNIIIVNLILSLGLFVESFFVYEDLYARCICLGAGVIIILATLVDPIIVVNNFIKNSKVLGSNKIQKTSVKFDENIVIDEGKIHLEFEYSQIKKISETKNFIILKLAKTSSILVYKNGFVEGTEKEFIEFISGKIK